MEEPKFINLPIEMHKLMIQNITRLETENTELKEKNIQLKKKVQQLNSILQYLDKDVPVDNKMDSHLNRIKQGVFKPRRNDTVDRKAVIRAILKLKTKDMYEIAKELNTSYPTVRRRLIEYNLYPINLQDIQLEYEIFGME